MVEWRQRSGQLTDGAFGDMSFAPPDAAVSFVAPTATLEGRAVPEDAAESAGAAAPFFGRFGSSFPPLLALVAAAAAGAPGVLLQGAIQSTTSPARAARGECTTQSQRTVGARLVRLQKQQQQQQIRRGTKAAERVTEATALLSPVRRARSTATARTSVGSVKPIARPTFSCTC